MTQAKPKAQPENQTDAQAKDEVQCCGIIMPISAMGPYEKTHWDRVRLVLDEAITAAGYRPRLVSESEDIGVIHSRIVQNLHDDPIVVCDVSGKNANVMFELGLRLAFDKPTIVIIDDQTDYSFDTSPIEHIKYRADLRYDDVRALQKKVTEVITATIDRKAKEPGYSPFIGHFAKFKVAGLETKELESTDYIMQMLSGLKEQVSALTGAVSAIPRYAVPPSQSISALDALSQSPYMVAGVDVVRSGSRIDPGSIAQLAITAESISSAKARSKDKDNGLFR